MSLPICIKHDIVSYDLGKKTRMEKKRKIAKEYLAFATLSPKSFNSGCQGC